MTQEQPSSSSDFRVAVRDRAARPGFATRTFGFVWWVLTGFGLLPILFRKVSGGGDREEITVYSVHRSFFLWLIILAGFICAPIANHYPADAHPQVAAALGWIYVAVIIYTFVTLLFDVNTVKLMLWLGIFLLIWISAKYLQDLKNIPILGNVRSYMLGLHPQVNGGLVAVVSWLLLPAWIGSLFNTFLNGRKRFSPNEISEFHIGEGHDLTDRTGLRFRAKYRDLFETFLGLGAGDVIAMDNRQVEIKRYENILFLAFVWKRLDAILHQRSTFVDNAASSPVEVEQVAAPAPAPPVTSSTQI